LNTLGSSKDMLWHRNWSQQLGEDLKVVEYLGGKAMYERHSCRQNFVVNSVELCQVGIERVHSGALRKEL
jgi:hypothetical protein